MTSIPQTARILKALNARKGGRVSTAVLARNAGVTRDQLYRRVVDLRNDGFDIVTTRDPSKDVFYYSLAA